MQLRLTTAAFLFALPAFAQDLATGDVIKAPSQARPSKAP